MMDRVSTLLAIALLTTTSALLLIRQHWIHNKTELVRHLPEYSSQKDVACSRNSTKLTVMIGDSRLSRWPTDLLPGSHVANEGIGGETLSQLAARFDVDALARCPDTILISSGINDLVAASLMKSGEADAVVAYVSRTLVALAERGARTGARTYVTTIVPPATPDLLRRFIWSSSVVDYVECVNADLRRHAWIGSMVLLDFAARLDPGSSGTLDPRYREDTLHLNRVGYAQLQDVVLTAVQQP